MVQVDDTGIGRLPEPVTTFARLRQASIAKRVAATETSWRPSGRTSALKDGGSPWGSWAPPWGQQARGRLKPLRVVQGRGVASTGAIGFCATGTAKEFGFVARAMSEEVPQRHSASGSSLEAVLEDRRRQAEYEFPTSFPSDAATPLPSSVGRLLDRSSRLLAQSDYPSSTRVLRPFAGRSVNQLARSQVECLRLPNLDPGDLRPTAKH
eukprot:TRINITY_DN76252_c0_g1_i1.p1 TRINITY_DN76252_c0_g1~~TRINITY_DN76252_c0_g1_i1.p1  ORF type:complete len:238 (-),score=22.11 TRINITY_DN76252_c0_g1_i1:121-747(-)